ncbi:histidine kinase [Streptomyces sp. A7024]|uniref:Histidine kinase n=1 Tax=Streptomyces coryli TaxID=1128680 RepID=A0A6G4U1B8_9ACTN|nr:histidine kinase [Streptomyces coryli]
MEPGAAGLSGFRRYTWWSLEVTVTLSLALFTFPWLLDPDVPVLARGVAAPALAVAVAAVAVLLSRRLDSTRLPVGWSVAGWTAAAVLGAVVLAERDYGLWVLPPATMVAVAATYLPARRRWWLIGAAVVGSAALGGTVGAATGDGVAYAAGFPAGMVVFVAWVTLGMLWSWEVAGRLNAARALAAELAVKDERLRFAADLHDIQGHHLQVIALKSELAARLAVAQPDRAAAEMKEVQRLATDALTDTRAVVQGYRRTTLDAEIRNATRVLAAAGIDARMRLAPATDRLREPARHLLGLVMREATTNMLRHSQAVEAEIGFGYEDGRARLRISNDGAPPPGGDGTGLAGLAQRLEAAGGDLAWEHADGTFAVTATLPVGEVRG